ncbi:hypothetical protein ABFS83_11G023400 [Erythranthe nasuta]
MDIVKDGIDDEFRLVLKLSETDPFFEKKQKLLVAMGFDPNILLCAKSSSTPDQLNDFVDALVRRARLVNFNEIELYFGGDVVNLKDCNSPRNEMEALHSILEAIDKSPSAENYATKNIQQCLREEIILRIANVGKKFEEETVIIKDFSCDKEKSLLDWGVEIGVKTKLDIACVEGAGRGAIAKEDLQVGDIAMEIPVSIVISEELLYESEMFPILEKVDGISEETMLLLWSMKEKYNKNSKFKLYFDSLPDDFQTGLSFGINAVMALDGSLLLEEIMQAKEHLRTQYDELFPALSNYNPNIFPPELYTWEKFLWACELWYSNSMKVIFTDGKLRTCLIPIAGFLNHSICPHIMNYGRIDAKTNSLKFPLSRKCGLGEQCFLSYGNLSSSHLLTFYGFLPKGDNPFDVIPLDFDIAQDEESEFGVSACEWSSHMVRGTWLSKNHEIFYYGLPPSLLDHLRRARNPAWRSNDRTQEILESEIDVLGDLSSTFEGMMEALGDEELEERENESWDVKLTMEFKNLQRRIVSSILTSCNAGCDLLQSELLKLAP